MNATAAPEIWQPSPSPAVAGSHAPLSGTRVRSLDGLRGIAVIMVLGIHFLYAHFLPEPPPRLNSIPHLLNFGWMGVDLFLVLSGFLITGILLDTREEPHFLRNFYARRALRIFPLYYVYVTAAWATAPLQRTHPGLAPYVPDPASWPYFFTYLSNWFISFSPKGTGYFALFWTLALEEQFYLFWPLMVARLRRRAFTVACLAICLLVPVIRTALALHPGTAILVLVSTLTRMDSLVWGALAALLLRSPAHWQKLRPWLPAICGLCGLLLLLIDFPLHDFYTRGFPTESVGFSIIAIGFSSLLLLAVDSERHHGRVAHLLQARLLRSFGRYSYGMYILHPPILIAYTLLFQHARWFGYSLPLAVSAFALFLATCFAFAALSFNLFEVRFLALKRHFESPAERKPLW